MKEQQQQHESSIRNTGKQAATGPKDDGIATIEDQHKVEFLNFWRERLKAARHQQSQKQSTILQNKTERTIVVKLLRMLNASQQIHKEKITERRQLRKVLRMLNKARKVKLNMFDAQRKAIEKLRQEKEKEKLQLNQYWQQNLKESKDMCEKYIEQNASLERTISSLKRQGAKQSEKWRHVEIENREKFIEEKILLERKLKETQQLQENHDRDIAARTAYEQELNEEKETLQSEKRVSEEQLEEIRTSYSKMQSEMASVTSNRDREIVERTAYEKEFNEEKERLQREKRVSEEQLEEIRTSYSKMQSEMASVTSNRDREIAERTAYEKELNEEKETLEREKRVLKEQLEETRTSYSRIKSEMASVTSNSGREIVERTAYEKELNEEKETLEREKQVLKEQLEETRTSYSQIQSEMASVTSNRDREIVEKAACEQELNELRGMHEAQLVQQQSMQTEIHSLAKRQGDARKESEPYQHMHSAEKGTEKHSQPDDIEDKLQALSGKREEDKKEIQDRLKVYLQQMDSRDWKSKLNDPDSPSSALQERHVIDKIESELNPNETRLGGGKAEEIGEGRDSRKQDPGKEPQGVKIEQEQEQVPSSAQDATMDPRNDISHSMSPAQKSPTSIQHDSSQPADLITRQVEQNIYFNRLAEQQALLQGISFDSNNASGYQFVETTGDMEAIAREMQEEGGIQFENENLEVEELRILCQFLKHDRSELARVTNVSWRKELTLSLCSLNFANQ
jgi:hypothetical protein